MGTVLRSVDVFSPDRGFRTLGREDVRCEYRFFGLKDGGKPWFAISGIVLALRPAEPEAIRTALRDNIERKLRVQPVRSWSAGCVFKNPPEGTSAGKLLDEAGFRGKRLGGMCFSEIHANFLSTKVRAARTPRLSSSVRRRAPYGNGLGSNCRRK